jgi:deoxyuridine 5'-triphosphate nucleotidohydrolase
MTFDQIVAKMKHLIKTGHIIADYPWDDLELLQRVPNFRTIAACFEEEVPEYRFAMREDLKNDPRFLPTRATSGSSGWDVACAFEDGKSLLVQPGQYLKIPVGLRCIPPEGYWYEMRPRSSTFTKKKLSALYGVADFDYRGDLYFCAQYTGSWTLTLEFGEKIGQIIPKKLLEMKVQTISNEEFDNFCKTEKNERKGGFGSSSR